MADAFVFQSRDFGWKLRIDRADGGIFDPNALLGQSATIVDFGSGTPPDPQVRLAYDSATGGNPGYSVRVVYPFAGPTFTVSGLGHAAQHRNTTPWALLPAGDRRENFIFPPAPAQPVRINYVTVVTTTERKDTVFNWEFYSTSTSPVTATPNVGPVNTLSIVSPESSSAPITIVTRASDFTQAGRTITFKTLADLAQFAKTDAATILSWVGGAAGVNWRAVG